MKLVTSGFWFGMVGAAAAATHAAVFGLALPWIPPAWANAVGFCVAFMVSFTGHRRLSFHDTRTSVRQSLARFLPTALAGFGTNEVVFVLLIKAARWPVWVALVAAMIVAAGQTFVLSRYWAFKR